jgi:hypothetical protein
MPQDKPPHRQASTPPADIAIHPSLSPAARAVPTPEQQSELERKLTEQFADGEDVELDADDLLNNFFTDEQRLAAKPNEGKA